jgi:hypothetical protein
MIESGAGGSAWFRGTSGFNIAPLFSRIGLLARPAKDTGIFPATLRSAKPPAGFRRAETGPRPPGEELTNRGSASGKPDRNRRLAVNRTRLVRDRIGSGLNGSEVREVHDGGDRRPGRLLAEMPGRAPGQAVVSAIGYPVHSG